jgi:hypothetical protein
MVDSVSSGEFDCGSADLENDLEGLGVVWMEPRPRDDGK